MRQEMQEVRQRDEKAQAWASIAKTVRAAVRLRHSLNADEEINQLLGPMQERFEQLYDAGLPIEFDSDKLRLKKRYVRTPKNVTELKAAK